MLTRMEWLRSIAILVGIVIAIWLALVAVIWLHRPSRHPVGAAVRLLPDTLRMLRSIVADPSTPGSSAGC